MEVSVAIVSYNTKYLLKRCLLSIYKYLKEVNFEVIVVDNGSTDGSADMVLKEFPQVVLIGNRVNEYFTKANNQAFKRAKGKYFILLNSDTYFEDNAIKKIILYFQTHSTVGAIEGLEIYENGKLVPNGSQFSTPLLDFYELSIIGKKFADKRQLDAYRLRGKNRRTIFPIDVGCDAFLAIRKDVWQRVKGYDERFFLYYTENDICKRIKEEGFSIVHLGKAHVVHTVSASADKLRFKKLQIYYHDMHMYYMKHGDALGGFLLFLLLQAELIMLRLFRPHMFSRSI